jgi:hypothetical protein
MLWWITFLSMELSPREQPLSIPGLSGHSGPSWSRGDCLAGRKDNRQIRWKGRTAHLATSSQISLWGKPKETQGSGWPGVDFQACHLYQGLTNSVYGRCNSWGTGIWLWKLPLYHSNWIGFKRITWTYCSYVVQKYKSKDLVLRQTIALPLW